MTTDHRVFLYDGYQAKPREAQTSIERGYQAKPKPGPAPSSGPVSLPKTASVVQKPKS